LNLGKSVSFLIAVMSMSGCVARSNPPNGESFLFWNFPANSEFTNPTCDQAGVSFVYVTIDGVAYSAVDCFLGHGGGGFQTPVLGVGTHSVTIQATDANGFEYYHFSGDLPIVSGQSDSIYALDWSVGGITMGWQLNDGALRTCAAVDVSTVEVQIKDLAGNVFLFDPPGDSRNCTEGNFSDSAPGVFYYLAPGSYEVSATAIGGFDDWSSDVVGFSVGAGSFPDIGDVILEPI
jgi:hypothetical protein